MVRETNEHAASANANTSDARVVVARAGVDAWGPAVHMDVFDLHLAGCDGGRHEHMIKLLLVVVEHVGIPLSRRDVREFIGLGNDAVESGEDGSCLYKLIEVSSEDEARRGVQLEE